MKHIDAKDSSQKAIGWPDETVSPAGDAGEDSRAQPAGPNGSTPRAAKRAAQSAEAPAEPAISVADRRTRKRDIVAKIGCALVAFVIWVYVMANDSPAAERTFESVPVQLTGQGEYALISGITDVTVTIKGRRGMINQLDPSAIQAFVDISAIRSPGWQKVKVDVSVPSGTTLQSVSPESMLLYFGNSTTVSVPVDVDIAEYTLPEEYVLGVPSAKPSEITVTGPEDLLSRIKSARATITLGQISGSVTAKAPLTLVDEEGKAVSSTFIKMQYSEATVEIPVFRQVSLPLTLSYKYGYYNNSNVQITWSPETILVRGETSAIENGKWYYTIDEKAITGDGQYTIPIALTEGLTNVSGVTEATLTIKHVGTATKQVTLTNFAVINPEGLSYTLLSDELIVTLRGPLSMLSYLSDKNVTATIDLSGFKNPSGTVMAPVAISVPPSLANHVYEIGNYTMMVKLG